MDSNTWWIWLIVAIVVVVIVIIIVIAMKKESFSVDGSMNNGWNAGGLVYNTFDVVQPSIDTFADMVDSGCCPSTCVPVKESKGCRTSTCDPKDLLPDVCGSNSVYDVDIADPQTFMFTPSVKVNVHNRIRNQADPYRGDIPIVKDECQKGWFNSRYDECDANLDGYFSEYTRAKFQTLTSSYPMNVANEGTIMDACC